MSRRHDEVTVDEVCRWISVHMERIRAATLVTDAEVAKRMGCDKNTPTRLRRNDWKSNGAVRKLKYYLGIFIKLANALEISPEQLFERPTDADMQMARTAQRQHYRTRTTLNRARKARKLNQEQKERAALLEWIGL